MSENFRKGGVTITMCILPLPSTSLEGIFLAIILIPAKSSGIILYLIPNQVKFPQIYFAKVPETHIEQIKTRPRFF